PLPFLPLPDRVFGDIGKEQVFAGRHPDRALRPIGDRVSQPFQSRSGRDEFVEARVLALNRAQGRKWSVVGAQCRSSQHDSGDQRYAVRSHERLRIQTSSDVGLNLRPSNNPRSLIFKLGMTNNAMKDSVMNGAVSVEP